MRFPYFLTSLILVVMTATTALADPTDGYPFCPGERLHYSLRWEAISAGEAYIEVRPMTRVAGKDAIHFRMKAWTNSFVDVFYKVRDEVDAYVSADMRQSLLYVKKQREGSYKRDITVNFDWAKSTAQYENKINGKKKPIMVLPGTFDPLSIFYAFRTMPVQDGSVLEAPVTDGTKFVIGEARVIRREQITVPAGTFDCILVEPEIKDLGGVFKKSKNAALRVWVTADERKIPVLIASKVAVGYFKAVLVKKDVPAGCYPAEPVAQAFSPAD